MHLKEVQRFKKSNLTELYLFFNVGPHFCDLFSLLVYIITATILQLTFFPHSTPLLEIRLLFVAKQLRRPLILLRERKLSIFLRYG